MSCRECKERRCRHGTSILRLCVQHKKKEYIEQCLFCWAEEREQIRDREELEGK